MASKPVHVPVIVLPLMCVLATEIEGSAQYPARWLIGT